MTLLNSLTASNMVLAIVLLCSCAAIRKADVPVFEDLVIEALTDSDDPAEMAEVASRFCSYSAPPVKRIAAFKLSASAFRKARGDKTIALVFSKCAFFVYELAYDEKQKATIAQHGLEAAAAAGADEKDPVASYYYGVHLGLITKHKGLAALDQLPRLEAALITAAKQPETDYGGPLRALGMLYLRAPAWPQGIGDLDKALELLERAADDFPEHPQNHLCYAYALQEDGQIEEAFRHVEIAVQESLKGDWSDFAPRWQQEIEELKEELGYEPG